MNHIVSKLYHMGPGLCPRMSESEPAHLIKQSFTQNHCTLHIAATHDIQSFSYCILECGTLIHQKAICSKDKLAFSPKITSPQVIFNSHTT